MASKSVFFLLALLGAVLLLHVAIADEVDVNSGDSPTPSSATDLDVDQDAEVVNGQSDASDLNDDDAEFDDSTVEDPEAATDDPDAESDNADDGDEHSEATDLVDDSEPSDEEHGTMGHLLARMLRQKKKAHSKWCRKRKQCRQYKKPGCCKKKCVSLLYDSKNCGRCGHKCNSKKNYVCTKGVCKKLKKPVCPPGKVKCKGKCKNLHTDSTNCGKCGKKCKFGYKCCGGRCKDILKDEKNCGRCGKTCRKHIKCTYGICGYGHS
ncbi:hypothetical protein M758_6G033000 [Ceratodon purpureus]|nr:hypothetical protein M758_6G033000 [Ceratodon purpureus]